MLKTTIDDGTQQLRFQEKVAEAGAVNGDVRSADVFPVCGISHSSIGHRVLLVILLLVVQQFVIVLRHAVRFLLAVTKMHAQCTHDTLNMPSLTHIQMSS